MWAQVDYVKIVCGVVSYYHLCGVRTALSRLMKTLIWHWPLTAGCLWEQGWDEGQGLNKGTIMTANTLVPEKTAPPTLTLKSDNSVLSICPWCFLSCWHFARILNKFLQASMSVLKPFKRMFDARAALCLTRTDSLLIFTTCHCGDSFSCFGLGSPLLGWNPSLLPGDFCSQDIPSNS